MWAWDGNCCPSREDATSVIILHPISSLVSIIWAFVPQIWLIIGLLNLKLDSWFCYHRKIIMSKSQDLKNQNQGPCKNLTKSRIWVRLIAKKLKYVHNSDRQNLFVSKLRRNVLLWTDPDFILQTELYYLHAMTTFFSEPKPALPKIKRAMGSFRFVWFT